MKIAIIGAGITGLACAIEFERQGIYPDVFERDSSVGWIWSSVSYWPSIFYRDTGDVIDFLKQEYGIYIKPLNECNSIILKSPNQAAHIEGNLGHFLVRGKGVDSLENQLKRDLTKTTVHYNRNADYKELAKKYDWVVVATGSDAVARELGVWKDDGLVRVVGGVALGDFNPKASTLYLNTDYAGSGYARVTPFSSTQAIVGIYTIGRGEFETIKLFSEFLDKEKLAKLEFIYKLQPNPFTTGTLAKYQVNNVLLAGRAAGLTERMLGVGAPEAIMSGVLAARAVHSNQNYAKLLKPLIKHVENLSSFRKVIDQLDNDGFDRLISTIDAPRVKKIIYNTKINFAHGIGRVLKQVAK